MKQDRITIDKDTVKGLDRSQLENVLFTVYNDNLAFKRRIQELEAMVAELKEFKNLANAEKYTPSSEAIQGLFPELEVMVSYSDPVEEDRQPKDGEAEKIVDFGNRKIDALACDASTVANIIVSKFDDHMTKSALSVALAYPLERKESLMAFLDIPYATFGNQAAENMIRPFVVGRKSFLFCITETGADVSAFLYSLVESCKAMDINVEDYLTWLFLNRNRVKDGDRNGWRKMLPGQSDIFQGRLYRERLRTAKADPDRSEPYVLRGKRV